MRENTNTVIRNEQVDTVAYGVDVKRLRRDYEHYVNKFDNLDEMDKCLECQSTLTQGKRENLITPISINDNGFISKIFPHTQKVQAQIASIVNFI